MNAALPDVSLTDAAPVLSPLQWVGMQNIALPVMLDEPDYRQTAHARADVQVDLPTAHVKGIHMSRLYHLLDTRLAAGQPLSPAHLRQLLQALLDSHHDCGSRNVRLRLAFALLVRRQALVSETLAGWRSYPVQLDASLVNGQFLVRLRVTVEYSSTCPCSAALSRQLVEQHFLHAFAGQELLKPAKVADWLRQHATLATPHSQRSEARVSVKLPASANSLGILELIEQIEQALGTPVQTAVKRADEQAFAALNGQNLMFVEDAARRIQSALAGRFARPRVHVRHLESLHPHDAAAWSAPEQPGAADAQHD